MNMQRVVKTFMPLWTPFVDDSAQRTIENMADADERAMAWAAHHYFQGDYEATADETEAYRMHPCTEIRSAALLLHAMANVGLGNAQETRADIAAILQMAKQPQDAQMAAICDMMRFLLQVFFHTDGEHQPVGEESIALLPEGLRLYLLYAMAHGLYLEKRHAEALGMAKAALMMAAGRFPPVCVYLNLVASMAASNLPDAEQAAGFFHQGWVIAEKEGYIQPFVEHHGLLQGQIEKYIRDRKPEVYGCIVEKVMAFSRGWMQIHNPRSVNKVTDRLSPYEFALAMLAAKGKSNQAIADYLHISINTVKFHLSNIYQKVGVSSRSELEQYMNR